MAKRKLTNYAGEPNFRAPSAVPQTITQPGKGEEKPDKPEQSQEKK
jgi:hypothetical protein